MPPNVGGPLSAPSGVPSLPMIRANPWMSPTASFTPGTASTVSSASIGVLERCSPPKSTSTKLEERTYASTSRKTSENNRSNVLFSVSEKMYVPDRKLVPKIMANEVSMSRPLRASVIFNDSRNMLIILRGASSSRARDLALARSFRPQSCRPSETQFGRRNLLQPHRA